MEYSGFIEARRLAAEEYDRLRMREALISCRGVVLQAAAALGVSENFFWKRAKAISLDIPGIRAEVDHPKGRYDASTPS
jgi:transcriptional regulator of acetoin/glycerol metabolism